MPALLIAPHLRIEFDPGSRIVRSWFDPSSHASEAKNIKPRDIAWDALRESADLFGWKPDLPDLRDKSVQDGVNTHAARFAQEWKGVPVDGGEVVVSMNVGGEIYSVYNHFRYDIPAALDPRKAKIGAPEATREARAMLDGFHEVRLHEPRLIVFRYDHANQVTPKSGRNLPHFERLVAHANAAQTKDGAYFLAWEVVVTTREPATHLRFLFDATTGRLITVQDLAQYASGTASVFDPNPVVTSGNTGLSWSTAILTLDGQRVSVTVNRLNAADGAGNLHLDGSFVTMEEFESPVVAEPANAAGTFSFSSNANEFLDAMAYYHIDRFQNYIQTTLGLTTAANFAIGVDPQGLEGQGDNSHYRSSDKRIAFGRRNGTAGADYNPVPDAADAMVILHEYGHAIQDNQVPNFNGFSGGVGEGFGDFLSATFFDDKHAVPANTRGIQMSFDANTTDAGWAGRRYDKTTRFDESAFTGGGGYQRAEVWASTMFELYRKLGGDSASYPSVRYAARDLAIRLHLAATSGVPTTGSTVDQWGQQIEASDGNLGGWRYANGLHKKVIYDTFRRRHMSGYPDKPVDVYINNGREGGYGSLTGNDVFSERLWQDVYWETQDLWVKVTPYADATAQSLGDPGDHVEPPVGSKAYLYVRVKNKGTNAGGSGSITVRAFHSNPGIGLVWPDDWTPADTPSITVANVLPGIANRIVVGPFPWTPTVVGHECVLAIVECANDRAVTQDLVATDHVEHSDLVPFDNNIAQRNLVPTAAKGGMKRGFYVRNPFREVRTVALAFDSTLPKGWRWRTGMVDHENIVLGPLERRWVDLVIEQGDGAEVTQFETPHRLVVSGAIDGKPIGGMTYYIAPDSAFGTTAPSGEVCVTKPGDALCLDIPWKDCEFEGEIELRIKFRSKR